MFKIESYITPILLSYVDKYIKNFRPEDSQVSLWGGDASFHNLDLRLEVLEEELQLPFCFVSGHIHELLIHVPWTKLASEPITITINTIECILKLRGPEEATQLSPDPSRITQMTLERARKAKARRELEAPPGYVQSLVNKIVGNIRIFCNNLILKYVEEDIVLSMNVKLLTFQSADANWQAAFTDDGQGYVTQRKIINVQDLTVCLDKRNASGKIDTYQEPMLYRCSMVVHFLRCYHSATLKKASTIRVDLYCKQMEFSMTEQQIPMLIRLIHLMLALHRRELLVKPSDKISIATENAGSDASSDEMEADSWAGWAWSFVPAVGGKDEEWNKQRELVDSGHTMQVGMYVDDASITFKVSESSNERYSGYYSQRKIKYHPLLSLKLQGIFTDTIIHGKCWLQASAGISEALLVPLGSCSCSQNDVEDNNATIKYLKAGSSSQLHKGDSLFDAEAAENKGNRKQYHISWDHHLDTTSEGVLLERTPAIAIDYLYQLIVPDDVTSEQLSEWGSDLEYSNMSERALFRIIIGPTRTRLCSGLLHRLSTLQAAASAYDYQPYGKKPIAPEKSFSELPPATEDDYDALNEQIPVRTTQLTILAPVIELQLMDHPWFEASLGMLIRKKKKQNATPSTVSGTSVGPQATPSTQPLSEVLLPKLTIECQCIDIRYTAPMYVNRLVHTVCQLPDPPSHMFAACYAETSVKIIGAYSRLILAANRHTYVVTPSSASYARKEIFKGKYWMKPDVVHEEVTFESECLTLTGTYPKLMCIMLVLDKFFKRDTEDSLNIVKSSSLIEDATRDFGMVYLEICIEGIRLRNVKTFSTVTIDASLGSVKAFIFDPIDMFYPSKAYSNLTLKNSTGSSSAGSNNPPYYATREIQQVLFISGPETINDNKKTKDRNEHQTEQQLFSVTLQYPKNPENQPHPPIVFFNLQEMCVCIDPLLCKFLLYGPRNLPPKTELIYLYDPPSRKVSRSVSDISASASETPRKLKTPRESIHSSSNEPQTHFNYPPKIDECSSPESINTDIQEQIYNFLKEWFDVWKGLLLYGDVSKCTIYFPIKTLSAVGSKGIQEAVQVQMTKPNPPDIMVFTLPSAVIRSSSLKQTLSQYIVALPVTVPEHVWNQNKFTFPWTLSISGLACYTYQNGCKFNCLKPVTLTATVGLSTSTKHRPSTSQQSDQQQQPDEIILNQTPPSQILSTATLATAETATLADWNVAVDAMSVTKMGIGTLSVCVHIDVTPVVLTTSEIQVCLIASIIHGLNEVLTNLLPSLPSLKPDSAPPLTTAFNNERPPNTNTAPPRGTRSNLSHKSPSQLHGLDGAEGSTLLGTHSSNTRTGTDGVSVVGGGGPQLSMGTEAVVERGEVKLTAWLQWTVARFTVRLLAHDSKDLQCGKNFTYTNEPKLKLVLDAEDIVSSLDFQSVFLKLKSKIGAASILHFVRDKPKNKWKPGPFLGIIMRTREDTVVNENREDINFANITITRASCNHTHNLWGAARKPKTTKTKPPTDPLLPKSVSAYHTPPPTIPSRYITEIVIRMQPIDLVLSPITLRSYYMVLEPLIWVPAVPPTEECAFSKGRIASRKSMGSTRAEEVATALGGRYNMAVRSATVVPSSSGTIGYVGPVQPVDAHWNNRTLPLAYLECGGFRIIIPSQYSVHSSPKSTGKTVQFTTNYVSLLHDTCIFQVDKITLNPQAVNPICRAPIRPDLYQRAAQMRVLNVPGSDLEDRQYQLDVTAISFHTGKWSEFSPILEMVKSNGSKLKTMSENPALEWNSLGKNGLASVPHLNLWPIISKFDVSVVAAPAMVFKRDIICGHSIEWNFVSDILFTLSLSQIKLASALTNECSYVFEMLFNSRPYIDRPKVIVPYPKFATWVDEFSEERELDVVEMTRDSGFETSDLKSAFSVSVKTQDNFRLRKKSEPEKIKSMLQSSSLATDTPAVPFDILITAGKFSFVLYDYEHSEGGRADVKFSKKKKASLKKKHVDAERGYEASEEGSVLDEHLIIEDAKKFKPLLYLSFQQPNAFLSQLQMGQKLQLSVFDIRIKVSGPEYVLAKGIPTDTDFPIHLLETKPGEPNPDTGILPAFFTVKFSKGLGKAPTLDLEIAKPTRMLCSMERWKYLLDVYKQILDSYRVATITNREITVNINRNAQPFVSTSSSRESYSKFSEIKKQFCGISVLNIKLTQMLFTFKTTTGLELNFCFGKLNDTISITNRPERLTKIVHLDCVTIFVKRNDKSNLLLNPWSFSFEISLFWEPWQSADAKPQLQISAESDAIMVDISPEHIKTLQVVLGEVNDFLTSMTRREHIGRMSDIDDDLSSDMRQQHENDCEVGEDEDEEELEHEKEQHYKDDLRAGAFQFVDASGGGLDELPLPYQVMFWTRTVSAMAWRYPQPRALTKVRVFPVPFKLSTEISTSSTTMLHSASVHSTSSAHQLQQQQQVLCCLEYWSDCHGAYQPYANFQLSETEMCLLELPKCRPQPAVACVWRVVLTNPYGYARVLVSPRALAGCIRVDSYFNKHLVPDLTLAMNISTIHVSLYNHFNKDVDVRLPDCLTNYTLDAVIPESQCFLTVSIDSVTAYVATWNFKSALCDVTSSIKCHVLDYMFLSELPMLEPFTSRLEVSYSKCLGISFVSKPIQLKVGAAIAHTLAVSAQMWQQSLKIAADNTTAEPVDIIIMTHYVICNDTNLNLRFGQAGHEDIFLPSRCCHLYSWRSQKYKQMLRIALEEMRWIWSEPFRIDTDGTDMIHIPDEQLIVVITIKSLSATQKQVIFSGQLIICNTLLEHFDLKVLEAVEQDKEKVFKSSQSYIVGGKTTPPSILIDQSKKYMLRLRFFGLESAWTGDIPLIENTKCAQPWLVKVPLQERGQFLSIWCRIVVQRFPKGIKILAMLWPLFMVRSNLPVSAKVHIETPTLNVHLESTIKGRGKIQQLYCPGTIDHSHQLTFQLDSVTPTSNPYVPLNYSLVDQNNFFKKADKEDINEILTSIAKYEKTTWPYFNEEDEYLDYVVEDQPLTQVQVRYQNACQYSSALLVELLPWCLLMNSLGCTVALIVNEKELCRINHKGILAPPKLEETFYLGVGIGGTWNLSLPLQIANSDWGQSFYMPKIIGTIPLEGCIKTGVMCGPYICMVCINSSIVNEIRLLKIASTHVVTSHLNIKLRIACFAVPDADRDLEMPSNLEEHSIIVNTNLNETNTGVSITQWLSIGNVEITSNFALYMSFSTGDKYGWSCPIRVDKSFVKTSFVVKTNTTIVPLLLVSQECKGQFFLSLHHDVYPQLLIENNSGIELFCAQMSTLKDSNVIVPECLHFKWICILEDSANIFYTMPSISEKFPEIPQQNGINAENLVLATDPEGDPQGFLWSNPINVTNFNEQFVRIPYFGDVKVSVLNAIHTIRILIQSVSQAEISARDIRVRLSLHETDPSENKTNNINIKDTNSDSTNISSYFSAEESSGGPSTPRLNINQTAEVSNRTSTIHDQYAPSYSTALTKSSTKERKRKNEIVKHHYRELTVQRVLTIPTGGCCERDELNASSGLRLLLFIKRFTITLTSDLEDGGAERTEVASVALDNVGVTATKGDLTEVCVTLTELQVDNQMYSRGSFDFPVVLIGQKDKTHLELKSLSVPIMQLILEAQQYALLKIDVHVESWKDYASQNIITDIRDVHVDLSPLSAYIEDTFYYRVRSHLLNLTPNNLVLWRTQPQPRPPNQLTQQGSLIEVPQPLSWSAVILARPLVLSAFTIEPLQVLLSVHSSMKMYIALDHSPLSFGRFGKRRLITTSYRLGHALTMHYLSGALFGAGWVVGSLELLGSPGGLARAMGSGLRDFVTFPYHGMVQGPWAFLKGVTHGSASLMRHVTAGTLQSVTKLASSVARNLDRLTLDEEHLRRTEEQRRQRPQGLAQGLMQGLTGFGISLLGAVGGIAHHPLQSLLSQGGASPRSLAAGVGLGLVGVITKPLSGAAELVALTGEGLLQGAGWSTLPEPLSHPILHHMFNSCNTSLKYEWKFLQSFLARSAVILFAMDATAIRTSSGNSAYDAVSLILTADALVVVNVDEDMTQRVLSLGDLTSLGNGNDPTLLTLRLIEDKEKDKTTGVSKEKDNKAVKEDKLGEDVDPDFFVVEMDDACRDRVADYVRNTAGLMHVSNDQQQQHVSAAECSEMSISPDEASPQRTVIMTEDLAQSGGRPTFSTLTFYVNPQSRNYFLCLFTLAKQQLLGNRFSVL